MSYMVTIKLLVDHVIAIILEYYSDNDLYIYIQTKHIYSIDRCLNERRDPIEYCISQFSF